VAFLSFEVPTEALNLDLEQVAWSRLAHKYDSEGHVDVVSVRTPLGVFLQAGSSESTSGGEERRKPRVLGAAAGRRPVEAPAPPESNRSSPDDDDDDERADASLRSAAYPFLAVPYVAPYHDAFGRNSSPLLVHAVLLWGRLDGQAC
jgi:hypothetical protein